MNKKSMPLFLAGGCSAIAVAIVLVFCAIATGSSAASGPRKPIVVGPRTITDITPTYRFRSSAPGVRATKIRFRCALDSTKLRRCDSTFKPLLSIGSHVLRVQAIVPSRARSSIAVVRIVVRSAAGGGYKIPCWGLPAGGTEMVFPSPDGATLYGIRFGSGRSGIALVPQGGGNMCDWAPAVQPIVSKGVQVLIYEPASSASIVSKPGSVPQLDVEEAAAARALRGAGVSTLFVGGSCAGSEAALDSIKLIEPRPRGVVVLAGYSSQRELDTVTSETNLAYLYLSSESDAWTPISGAQALFAATGSSDKKLVSYPTSLHGVALFSSPFSSQIESEIADWLSARAS